MESYAYLVPLIQTDKCQIILITQEIDLRTEGIKFTSKGGKIGHIVKGTSCRELIWERKRL